MHKIGIHTIHIYFLGIFLIILVLNTGNFSYSTTESEPVKNAFFLLTFNLFIYIYFILSKLKYTFKYLFLDKIFLSYLIFLGFTILFRSDLYSNTRNFFNIILTYTIVWQLSNIMHYIPIKKLIILLSNYLFLVLAFCLFLYIKHGGIFSFLNHDPEYRVGGLYFFGTTAIIAGLTVLLNVVILSMGKRNAFILIKFSFAYMILFATDTRMVIFITTILSFLIFFRFIKRTVVYILACSFIFYLIINLFFTVYGGVERDVEFRGIIWNVAYTKIIERFFIGWGTENPFVFINSKYINFLLDPHSAYLSILLRQGIIASILLFWFYVKSIKRYIIKDKSILYLVIFFFMVSFVGTEIFNGNYSFLSIIFYLTFFGLFMHPGTSKILQKS